MAFKESYFCDNTFILSDCEYSIKCHLRDSAKNNNPKRCYRKYTRLQIVNYELKINDDFNGVCLVISECCFKAIIPHLTLSENVVFDIYSNKKIKCP